MNQVDKNRFCWVELGQERSLSPNTVHSHYGLNHRERATALDELPKGPVPLDAHRCASAETHRAKTALSREVDKSWKNPVANAPHGLPACNITPGTDDLGIASGVPVVAHRRGTS